MFRLTRLSTVFFVFVLLTDVASAQRVFVKTKGSVRVRVLLEDGSPAKNAHIHASIWTREKGFKSNQTYRTDADGWVTVKLPKSLEILRLWARKESSVPVFINWDISGLISLNKKFDVPEKFEFTLPAGTKMSGIVRNEDGQPIPGAEVAIQHTGGPGVAYGQVRLGTWLAHGGGGPDEHPALKTDKNGRWEINNIPGGPDTPVLLKLRHPDYVDDVRWGSLQKEQNITMDQYRDGSAVIVMKRGFRLRGLVIDSETRKPIKDAVVVIGDDPYFQTDSQEVRTNEKGFYEFPPQSPVDKLRVTVMAPGYAPAMKFPEINEQVSKRKLRLDASFRLKLGRTIRLRFVDQDGKPVPKVYVGIRGWREAKSLYNHKHPNVLDTKIPRRANEEGVWEWTWAPEDEVLYSFGLEGYKAPDELKFVARDEPHEIRLIKRP